MKPAKEVSVDSLFEHCDSWETSSYEVYFLSACISCLEQDVILISERKKQVAMTTALVNMVDVSWFTENHRKTTYNVLAKIVAQEEPITLPGSVLGMTEGILAASGRRGEIDGLREIAGCTFPFYALEAFEKVKGLWKAKLCRRSLLENASLICDYLTEPPSTEIVEKKIPELIEAQHEIWSNISQDETKSSSWSDAIDELLEPLPPDIAIPTGIKVLDRTIQGGIAKRGSRYSKRLIVLGGRPGMGKTATAVHIAAKIAEYNGDVAFFSLEMSAKQIMDRAIACVDYLRLRESGKLVNPITVDNMQKRSYTSEQVDRLRAYKGSNLAERLHIYEDTFSVEKIVSKVRLLSATREKLTAVVVDYLGLLDGCEGDDKGTEASNIGKVTKSLKQLAKRHGIDVILLAQVNRGVELRPNKMPLISDLRASGRIEEDADVIMFALRPFYYDQTKDPYELAIGVNKNRHGACGTLKACIDLKSSVVFDESL
jgi:replicative DNA helicase